MENRPFNFCQKEDRGKFLTEHIGYENEASYQNTVRMYQAKLPFFVVDFAFNV